MIAKKQNTRVLIKIGMDIIKTNKNLRQQLLQQAQLQQLSQQHSAINIIIKIKIIIAFKKYLLKLIKNNN